MNNVKEGDILVRTWYLGSNNTPYPILVTDVIKDKAGKVSWLEVEDAMGTYPLVPDDFDQYVINTPLLKILFDLDHL